MKRILNQKKYAEKNITMKPIIGLILVMVMVGIGFIWDFQGILKMLITQQIDQKKYALVLIIINR